VSGTIVVAMMENAALLLAMAVAFDLLSDRKTAATSLLRQVVSGFAIAAIGLAMIATSLRLPSGVIFDTRSVLLAVTGLFLGWIPMLVAVTITAGYRLYLGGPGAVVGVAVIVSSGLLGVLWRRIRRGTLAHLPRADLFALGIVVHVVMLGLLYAIPEGLGPRVVNEVWLPVLLVHPLATVMLGMLFTRRLRHSRIARALAESEERFRTLAENAQDLVYRVELVPSMRFSYVSPSATTLLGYTPEEFYADPALLRKIVVPDDLPILQTALGADNTTNVSVVLRLTRKDGRVVWGEQRSSPVYGESGRVVAREGIGRDVTEMRVAMEVLREQEQKLRLALESSNQALYDFDVATGIDTFTERYALMLGEAQGEFIETRDDWFERIHPDDRSRAARALEDFLAGSATEYRVEARRRRRDGSWIWTLSHGTVVARDSEGRPSRVIGTVQDVTALKQAELDAVRSHEESLRLLVEAHNARRMLLSIMEDQERARRALQQAQRLSQATLDALKDHICVLDENGVIVAVNAAWSAFAEGNGIPAGVKFEGQSYLQVCDEARGPDEAKAHDVASQLRTLLGGSLDSAVAEYPCHSPDEERWFRVQMTRFQVEGRMRVVVAHENVTGQRKAEAERLELTRQLFQSQKLESLGSLAGGIAHDINNVLAAISNAASAHRPKIDDAASHARALDTITNACVRGRSVVKSLLYFASEEVGSRGPVDLNVIARDIVELLGQTTLKRIALTADLEDALDPVWGDSAALSHAVMNLCLNSIDAMPNGGAISIRTRRRPDSSIEISVRDDGLGMSEEVRARAIEPFFTTKALGKGTGLGLAMVYGTMQAHGGTCEIRSEPGRGTEVTLSFPASSKEAALSEIDLDGRQPGGPVGKLQILLVDDDALILESLPPLLEAMGHEVLTSDGGLAAIARLEGGLAVDLVILDMNMPGMTGAEALPRILELRPDQAVLISSGFSDDDLSAITGSNPRVRSLRKPFTGGELEDALSGLLGVGRPAR
jgi:PAS domain S-box-containing protein